MSLVVATWHRKLIGEMGNRCIEALRVYEELDCFCYLGKPPRMRDPCPFGQCGNVNDMPRDVMDMVFAYAEGDVDVRELRTLAETQRCYSGPDWIKPLMSTATMGPKAALCITSPFAQLDEDVAEFLDEFK